MKNKFNQLLTLLFLFFTTQTYSSPIDKINFIGLNNVSENTILKEIPFVYNAIHSVNITESHTPTPIFFICFIRM